MRRTPKDVSPLDGTPRSSKSHAKECKCSILTLNFEVAEATEREDKKWEDY